MIKFMQSSLVLGIASASVLAAASVDANAQAMRYIYLHNDCYRPIEVIVHHADGYRNWHPHGWYAFQPRSGSLIEDAGITLSQSEDHELYVFARTTDGGSPIYWQDRENGIEVSFDKARYWAMEANDYISVDGHYTVNLTCDN